MIGLSGLITPSLDEMVHVAREMERQGFTMPLLIGGATTSAKHTAVKIAPAYSHDDGPRARRLAQRGRGRAAAEPESAKPRSTPTIAREQAATGRVVSTAAAGQARAVRAGGRPSASRPIGHACAIDTPSFLGRARARRFSARASWCRYIDWSPFFHDLGAEGQVSEDLRRPDGRRGGHASCSTTPSDCSTEIVAREAAARPAACMASGRRRRWATTSCCSPTTSRSERADPLPHAAPAMGAQRADGVLRAGRFHRPARERPARLPRRVRRDDRAWASTNWSRRFEADHDDYNAIMVKALADRLAEAFAECLHQTGPRRLGLWPRGDNCRSEDLIEEKYRGIRPAPGYPACPDHTEKRILFDLLDAEQTAGITLTENFAMCPAASVSGLYFAHPESRYFAVDRIARDQVEPTPAAKGCRWPKSSAGWRRIWDMSREDLARIVPGLRPSTNAESHRTRT